MEAGCVHMAARAALLSLALCAHAAPFGPDGRYPPPTDEPVDPTTGCRSPSSLRRVGLAVDGTFKKLNFSGVQEVQFVGVMGPVEQRRVCKIKCINGQWLGPLCSIEEDGGRFQPMLRNCRLDQVPRDLLIFYNGRQLDLRWEDRFAHGTTLSTRCRQIGSFKFVGNSTLRCRNGLWDRRLPICIPTTYLTNFSVYSPPTIIYQLAQGSAAPSDAGDLLVYPDSIVHLDCLFRRQDGNPQWAWTPDHRQYPTGWAVPLHEKDWKYRLSIYYAKSHDAGIFTCTTPKGSSNSIVIRVSAVECPPINITDPNQAVAFEGHKINHRARFSCADGSILIGVEEVVCLWTGQWSDDFPICHALQCSTLAVDEPHLRIDSQNVEHKGRAEFSCRRGFRLIGSQEILCLYGNWTDFIPHCEEIICEAPPPPENGRVLDDGRYTVDSRVQYICDYGHLIVGESDVLVCTQQATWSHTPPTCKPACAHPGNPDFGRTLPSKEHYDLGNWVTVMCDSGYSIHGRQRLLCVKPGTWSHPLAECKPFNV